MHSSRVSTQAGVAAAQSSLAASDWAIRAAQAEVDRLRHQMSDGTLTATRAGRVLFRLAEPGEVLGAGGKVLTLLDLSDIYMTVFLPAGIAGGLAIGTEARLILEPIPDRAIPATVTFISSRAQFTPKQVETQSERDRMMFRIKVSIPTALVERFVTQVKTGVTGIAYIRIDPATPWPDWLQSDLTRTAGP
jgi:HlyD family secretion protein